MIKISLIAAVARNNVIGADQSIPWRIPSDFAWFKETTMGKPMIMGRKQFETFPKPLAGRPHIVVTRQEGDAPEGVLHFPDGECRIPRQRRGEIAIIHLVREFLAMQARGFHGVGRFGQSSGRVTEQVQVERDEGAVVPGPLRGNGVVGNGAAGGFHGGFERTGI